MLESLFKKRLQHKCFPVNIAKFLRAAFFIAHLWWLLLNLKIREVLLDVHRDFLSSDYLFSIHRIFKEFLQSQPFRVALKKAV